jgi:gamma-glutamylputrescine oxidase
MRGAGIKNYYWDTANTWETQPSFTGGSTCELLVIGGGFTGLSAALAAREKGLCVVLVEAHYIAAGASGRNGGQLIPGLRWPMSQIEAEFGQDRAKALFELAWGAGDRVRHRIKKHAIDCDLKSGHLEAAYKPKHFVEMQKEVEFLSKKYGWQSADIIPPSELERHVNGGDYHGGVYDKEGGHFHPVNYALGLARAAKDAGVNIYESSKVVKITKANSFAVNPSRDGYGMGERAQVYFANGASIMANKVLLATDAWTEGLEPNLRGFTVPILNYNITTAPLPNAHEFLPSDAAVADSRFVLNYFRLTADKRLMFGGGESYGYFNKNNIAGFVRGYMKKIFPQLSDVPIDYYWSGTVGASLNRLPHIGRLGKTGDVYYAHGFSGHGAMITTLAGELIAEAITGSDKGFDVFEKLPHRRFPGGSLLSGTIATLGLLYYALKDRL